MDEDEAFCSSPLYPSQMVVHTLIGDKILDFQALSEVWKAVGQPEHYLAWSRVNPYQNATEKILETSSFIKVSPCSGDFVYSVVEDDNDTPLKFNENDVRLEYETSHPGTTEDDGAPGGSSPITTTASQLIFSVALDAPGSRGPQKMKASFKHQLSMRIDEARRVLYLDCYEYKPVCVDLGNEADPPMPTNRSLQRFEDIINPMNLNKDNEIDEEWLDSKAEPQSGEDFTRGDIVSLNYKAMVGDFLHSRSLRLRLSLSEIVGIRLMKWDDPDAEPGTDDLGAVLILETGEKLRGRSFAARAVRSKYHGENKFCTVDDWTPREAATHASRYYFYGNLTELKQTAALMARDCARLAAMLASETAETNSLRKGVPVTYGTAPNLDPGEKEVENNDEDSASGSGSKRRRTNRAMTVADVHRAFVDANLVGSLTAANDEVNPCLKKAVLLGHVTINDTTTLATVLFEGKCIGCGETLLCTLKDAMEQPPCGENDCGEGAALRCPGCETGNHITGLCEGKARYDSGKFHNHCVLCPDFGECIGDYRLAHCLHCEQHYFRGNIGLPCATCGGGKCRDMAGMAPPPLSTWDGKIEMIREVFDSKVAREQDPMKRALMKMMVLGPQANCDGSEVMGAMSAMMSMMANSQGRAEPGADGPPGEGCPQM